MFAGKIVLITGGSSGIGASAALLFAKHGASVAFTYKQNQKGANATQKSIEAVGREALAIQANLSNEKEAQKVVGLVMKEFGRIDVLVNNAGRYISGDEWNGSSDVWKDSIIQNLVSMMSISKYVIEVFQKQKNGAIINIASRHGVDGQYDAISYAAAKAGVINITQAYAKLLAPYGRANSISPGATNAGYWLTAPKEELEEVLVNRPSHRLIDTDTIAEKVVFLASEEAKDITGQNFLVTD